MGEAPRTNVSTRSAFEERFGYCRAVRVGDTVFLSGTVGLDYDTGTIPDDPAAQFEQIVRNMTLGLKAGGASLSDMVQLTIYVTSSAVMEAIGPGLARVFGPVGPTNTTIVVAFPFDGVVVEIQGTAVVGCGKNVRWSTAR